MTRFRALLDRLPVRLFLSLWLALVLAHYLGYGVQRWWSPHEEGRPPPPGVMALPPADGLPPPGASAPSRSLQDRHGPVPQGGSDEPPMPLVSILIDYGVRLLVFGAAAALAARWVSRPLSRLHAAAGQLEQQVLAGQPPVPVPEHDGPTEVRQVASAYNRMSHRLVRQFDERVMMMAAVSHDLRTPLTRLRLRLEQPESPERRHAMLADLVRMDALIEQVLMSVRAERQPPPRQALDLVALVQACVEDHAESGRPVRLSSPDLAGSAEVVVRGDAAALRRVLDNLIDNAVRHGRSACLSLAPPASDGRVAVHVDDEGPGIPSERIEAMFQPFARLDQARAVDSGGAGLGLYIARQLAHRQGATVTLSNRPEGGLRASVRWALDVQGPKG